MSASLSAAGKMPKPGMSLHAVGTKIAKNVKQSKQLIVRWTFVFPPSI
jgi:hypothetical protein